MLALVLAALSALPFVITAIPQLTDYPSHLARYHVMLDGGRDPFLARYYDFEWQLTGNLGADLLIWPLAKLFGLEPAGRLIGLVIPPLTGLGLVAVEWTLRRRVGIGTMLAFALIWSPAMGMGFYNFCLSLALALLFFALWVRLEERPWRWALFLALGFVTWLCHASGWGVLGVLVFGYEWHRRKSPRAVLAPWPLALPVMPMLLGGGVKGALSYGAAYWAYKRGIWLTAMRDQSQLLDIGTVALVLLILLAALVRRKIDGRLGWAALILLVLTFAMPRHFGGGDYADYRLISVALMIGCMAIDWRAPRWVVWLAPLLFLVRLDVTSIGWVQNDRLLRENLTALEHLPQGARVVGVVVVELQRWPLNPFEHAPSFATVRRNALVNTHFAIPGIHMLRLKEGGPNFVDPSHRILHLRGERILLHKFEGVKHADYLWYFGRLSPDTMPAGAEVIHATRHSFLARLANHTVAR